MKKSSLIAVVSVLLLASCKKETADADFNEARSQGRYTGVGVYNAGDLWGKIMDAPTPADPHAATIRDDEHVIVVVDTRTGEIRQCGDHSGYCVAISPWAASNHVPALPSKLSAHAGDETSAKAPEGKATDTQ